MPCVENPLALAPGLHSWEQTFIKDCPTSPFGDVRPFDFSSRNSTAAAHFTLGLKALHNFFFDLCKYEFDQARLIEPTLFMAYWGRALCEAQLVWNGENVPASVEVIRAAQSNPEFPGSMSERELAYFQSVVTLNGGIEPPSTPDTVVATRPARIAAYGKAVSAIAKAYPEDQTAQSFLVVAALALGSVGDCANTQPPPAYCKALQEQSRVLADLARASNPTSPGTLHYGMHAHDFPNRSAYTGGRKYAIAYPKYVTEQTHSLHMPSHIWDRIGAWANASAANEASVAAADAFAASGALEQLGSHGYAFDSGNVYHSLEYQQYELLQGCHMRKARMLWSRMGYAAAQAMFAPRAWSQSKGSPDPSPQTLHELAFQGVVGTSWYNATTFMQWEYRMAARQAVWSLLTEWLGGAASSPDATSDWRGFHPRSMPNPLAWQGQTVYIHSFFSAEAEAALNAAHAVASLYDNIVASGGPAIAHHEGDPTSPQDLGSHGRGALSFTPLEHETRGGFTTKPCDSASGCISERVAASLHVLERAREHCASVGRVHEGAGVRALELQVRALMALAQNNGSGALDLLGEAAAVEEKMQSSLVPSSITLFYLPSTAIEGTIRLALLRSGQRAQLVKCENTPAMAVRAFSRCLEPLIHPRMPLCLLGRARAFRRVGNATAAARDYRQLLSDGEWDGAECEAGLGEAKAFLSGLEHTRPDDTLTPKPPPPAPRPPPTTLADTAAAAYPAIALTDVAGAAPPSKESGLNVSLLAAAMYLCVAAALGAVCGGAVVSAHHQRAERAQGNNKMGYAPPPVHVPVEVEVEVEGHAH